MAAILVNSHEFKTYLSPLHYLGGLSGPDGAAPARETGRPLPVVDGTNQPLEAAVTPASSVGLHRSGNYCPAPPGVEPLYAPIGRLQMKNQLLKKAAAMCVAQQRALVQASGKGAVQARCQAMGLDHGRHYYRPYGDNMLDINAM